MISPPSTRFSNAIYKADLWSSEPDLEAKNCQETLHNLFQQILESNLDISRRLRSLEEMNESQSVLTRCFSNGKNNEIANSDDDGDTATTTENTQAISDIFNPHNTVSREATFRFSFEDDLETSRVYSRIQIYKEDVSFTSSAIRTQAWSIFSGLSLAEISIISAIALPLSLDDILKNKWYKLGTRCKQAGASYVRLGKAIITSN